MSLVRRKEFAAMCGKPQTTIGVYVKRGKIIEIDREIDTEDPINKAYMDKCMSEKQTSKEKKADVLYNEVVHKKTIPIATPKKTGRRTKEQIESSKKSAESLDWDLRKKKAEALKAERAAEKLLIEIKKLNGEMLPTDFVLFIFKFFSNELFAKFQSSNENLASTYCDELAGGDRESLARINQRLDEELQSIIEGAKISVNRDIKNKIKEFSESRSRGQKI